MVWINRPNNFHLQDIFEPTPGTVSFSLKVANILRNHPFWLIDWVSMSDIMFLFTFVLQSSNPEAILFPAPLVVSRSNPCLSHLVLVRTLFSSPMLLKVLKHVYLGQLYIPRTRSRTVA